MMHRAWSSIVEVPYCFSRSYVKFQGHTALEIVEFDPNWAFPDCNSSFNSPMAMKCCTKLQTAKERCPIVFQCHPSNFKVTRDKTSPILTQIGRFRTKGRSQLSNPSDLPCLFLDSLVWLWISSLNFNHILLVCMERSLLIFSNVLFKMADWWRYWIFLFLPEALLSYGYCHCLSLCVCVSVCVSTFACLDDNSSPVQARFT